MKGVVILFITLALSIGLSAQVLTCRQIQETTAVNGNSPYMDQIKQVRGIVTAVKAGASFYLSDPVTTGYDGKWTGLYVYDAATSNTVHVGDMVRLTGTVKEMNGVTQLRLITDSTIESPGNPIPINHVTTAMLPFSGATSEPWEGVMVSLNNVKITTSVNIFNQFQIADAGVAGVAESKVDDFFYTHPSSEIVVGDVWHQIQGVVDFSTNDGYKILPRSSSDMIKEDNILASKISIQSLKGAVDEVSAVEVRTTKLLAEWNVLSYSLTLNVDASKVEYMGVDLGGTLTASSPTVTLAGDLITIDYTTTTAMIAPVGETTLVKVLLKPRSYGVVPIEISSFSYNNTALNNFEDGTLSVVIDKFEAYLGIDVIRVAGSSYSVINSKNAFNPHDETLRIQYGTKGGFLARTIIRIYDAQGRLVATPLNENFTGLTTVQQIGEFQWNGRDGAMNLLPPGLYYCHMEVANRETGAIARATQPIIIKSRLK